MAKNSQTESNDADVKQGLLTAYRRFMGPLVRILIRNGISFDEFADELKGVFVEIAHDDFPIDGRNPSGTRIAILTGLTRKEVKRQLEKREGGAVESTGDPNWDVHADANRDGTVNNADLLIVKDNFGRVYQ